MTEPNILLDALLEEAGVSYAGLASRLNQLGAAAGKPTRYDHTSVARWVRDHAIPRGNAPEFICEIVGTRVGRLLTLADIDMDRGQPDRTDGETSLWRTVDRVRALTRGDLRQSALLRDGVMLAGAAAVAPVWEWENPPEFAVAHEGEVVVGPSDVRRLSAARGRYEQMYRRVGGIPVRPRVLAYLAGHALPLLKGRYNEATGRELFRAAGGLVALAGISAYDADLQPLAQRYFFHALRMAKASRNRPFGGYVIALLANQSMHRANYRQVIQYAESALRGAHTGLSPALSTDLHTLQAKAFARMGDLRDCHEQMRRSESIAARIRPAEEPPETGYVQPGLLECQHAEALRQLGDLGAAQQYAEEAVRTAEASHLRGQAHRLATLALVLAQSGQAEEAANTATRMLDRTIGMESRRLRDRVAAVAGALRPYAGVRDVDECLERIDDQARIGL